jgi:hypothetical protein
MVGVGFAAVSALGLAGQLASGVMSAKARQAEFAQQLRALEMKKEQTIGIARARAAASGIEMSSTSTTDYLAGLTSEFDTELNYLRATKRMAGDAADIGNTMSLLGGAASIYGGTAQQNNFWR